MSALGLELAGFFERDSWKSSVFSGLLFPLDPILPMR